MNMPQNIKKYLLANSSMDAGDLRRHLNSWLVRAMSLTFITLFVLWFGPMGLIMLLSIALCGVVTVYMWCQVFTIWRQVNRDKDSDTP